MYNLLNLFFFKKKLSFNVFLGVWVFKRIDLKLNKYLTYDRKKWQIFSFKELFFIFLFIENILNKINIKERSLMFICDDEDFELIFINLILKINQYYLIKWIDGLLSNNKQILHCYKANFDKILLCTNFFSVFKLPKFVFLLSIGSEIRQKILLECSRIRVPVFNLVFIENDISSKESYYIIGNGSSLNFLFFFIKLITNLKFFF